MQATPYLSERQIRQPSLSPALLERTSQCVYRRPRSSTLSISPTGSMLLCMTSSQNNSPTILSRQSSTSVSPLQDTNRGRQRVELSSGTTSGPTPNHLLYSSPSPLRQTFSFRQPVVSPRPNSFDAERDPYGSYTEDDASYYRAPTPALGLTSSECCSPYLSRRTTNDPKWDQELADLNRISLGFSQTVLSRVHGSFHKREKSIDGKLQGVASWIAPARPLSHWREPSNSASSSKPKMTGLPPRERNNGFLVVSRNVRTSFVRVRPKTMTTNIRSKEQEDIMEQFTNEQMPIAQRIVFYTTSRPHRAIPRALITQELVEVKGKRGRCLIGSCRSLLDASSAQPTWNWRNVEDLYDHVLDEHFHCRPFVCVV
ncbi:hypothetical protein FRC18_007104, partial [Serendipita sp. 400]